LDILLNKVAIFEFFKLVEHVFAPFELYLVLPGLDVLVFYSLLLYLVKNGYLVVFLVLDRIQLLHFGLWLVAVV